MKNNMVTVIKKEFRRFFTDRRMVLTTLVMPGLMIYIVYSVMGTGLASQFGQEEGTALQVSVENLPQGIAAASKGTPLEFTELSGGQETDGALEGLREGAEGCDLVAVFPKDFEKLAAAYDKADGGDAPAVRLYYNSVQTDSSSAYDMMEEILDAYETSLANKFDVNPGDEKYDLATEEDMSAQFFSMMVPMLMMVFLFSGCMAVVPESIAGEKERGTIATLLVTPMKRSHLALGKIISLSVIAVLSGLSSFLGTMLSLPKLMGGVQYMDASVYGIQEYLLMLAVVISTVLLIVTLVSIVSAFAKNVKEATGWVTPIMIVSMLFGVMSMLDIASQTGMAWFLIPLYNSAQCMGGIFSLDVDVWNVAVTAVSNICYAGIGVFALTKMFGSEKVMFSK